METSRPLAAMPAIQYPPDIARRRLQFMVERARELGPIFRQDWPGGGRVVYMVGPEANKFVLQTHREHFSHDLGWTPNIGELMGKGLLNLDPPEHDRHRAELDAVLGPEGPLTLEGLKGLRQLGYAVQEAGRITPPVAMVPRGVLSDVSFGGYHLPAGTYVLLVLGAPHWDPAYFPEPERFLPERFAPPREEDKRTSYALGTFGGGPRICIGINFARIEVTALAAAVLRRYTLTASAPSQVRQVYPGLLGFPEHGIPVRVAPLAGGRG